MKLTPVKGAGNAETLKGLDIEAGESVVADRGYSHPAGINYINEKGGKLLVRLNPDAVRLRTATGELFNLEDWLKDIEVFKSASVDVCVCDRKDTISVKGRICALRKSCTSAMHEKRRLKILGRRGGYKPRERTLFYANYVIVFTTFDGAQFNDAKVLECYRLRWQIELVFKRFKQLARVGHLPKHDERSSRAWLYGKLFMALLTERLLAKAESFSPWGYDEHHEGKEEPMA